MKKPGNEIFLRYFSELGSGPAEDIFVGDNPEDDVMGAKAAGLRAVWMRNDNFGPPECFERTVSCINEIPEVLRLIHERSYRQDIG